MAACVRVQLRVRLRACVCMQVFMGPCGHLGAVGSDHSSSHKVTFSRQALSAPLWICSPQ